MTKTQQAAPPPLASYFHAIEADILLAGVQLAGPDGDWLAVLLGYDPVVELDALLAEADDHKRRAIAEEIMARLRRLTQCVVDWNRPHPYDAALAVYLYLIREYWLDQFVVAARAVQRVRLPLPLARGMLAVCRAVPVNQSARQACLAQNH